MSVINDSHSRAENASSSVDNFDGNEAHQRPLSISERAMAAQQGNVVKACNGVWLDGLNPEQKQAVELLDGPLLILAGAGTGKTRVLTSRIAHILANNCAAPYQILAVTFTNKAAREMKERIGGLIGGAIEGMEWLGTFHSIGTKILRNHAELVDLKSGFTILNMDDQIRLMKQIIKAENIDEKRWPARLLAGTIDGWKNRGLSPDQVPEQENNYANGKGIALYKAYQQRLQIVNAVDFGDLLLLPIKIFLENPDVLSIYHKRFRYILVDEYQDTNVAQYLWLRLLAKGSRNICCVGDDDQSIYGWRGAEVDNILRFEHDFEGATIIKLERNYRSTPAILGAASHLIAKNESRLGKTLYTDQHDEAYDKVTIASAWDSHEEARAIGDDIEALQCKNHKLNDMAILVRASYQMREFEDRFVTLGLNYRVIGGPRFYERAEIRDALAYLRVVQQPQDDLAFERIINTPRRGFGDASLAILHHYSRENQVPLYQAAEAVIVTDALSSRARNALSGLLQNFTRWREQSQMLSHTDLAEIILDESGYTAMWQNDKSPDAPGRLDNLKELIRSMQDFENLLGFLEHISLVMDNENSKSSDAISLMTLHAAKGLEFETVYLPGWEEGLFPSQRSMDENGLAGLEEERRLAYVGITRAKKRSKIWFSNNRRIHGMWQSSMPSRFIDELPEEHIDVIGEGASHQGHYGLSRFDRSETFQKSHYNSPGWQRAQKPSDKPSHANIMTSLPGNDSLIVHGSKRHVSAFSIEQRIFHQKFGHGTIEQIEGNKLIIAFDKAGRKKVLDHFVTA